MITDSDYVVCCVTHSDYAQLPIAGRYVKEQLLRARAVMCGLLKFALYGAYLDSLNRFALLKAISQPLHCGLI